MIAVRTGRTAVAQRKNDMLVVGDSEQDGLPKHSAV